MSQKRKSIFYTEEEDVTEVSVDGERSGRDKDEITTELAEHQMERIRAEKRWIRFGILAAFVQILLVAAFVLGFFHVIPGDYSFLPADGSAALALMPNRLAAFGFRAIVGGLMVLGYILLAVPGERRRKNRILKRLPKPLAFSWALEVVVLLGAFFSLPGLVPLALIFLCAVRKRLAEQLSAFDPSPEQKLLAWGHGLDLGWLSAYAGAQVFRFVLLLGITIPTVYLPWLSLAFLIGIFVASFILTRRTRNAAVPLGTSLAYLMTLVQVILDGRGVFAIVALSILAVAALFIALVCYVGNRRQLTQRPQHMRY